MVCTERFEWIAGREWIDRRFDRSDVRYVRDVLDRRQEMQTERRRKILRNERTRRLRRWWRRWRITWFEWREQRRDLRVGFIGQCSWRIASRGQRGKWRRGW